jgi:hypothetical protein
MPSRAKAKNAAQLQIGVAVTDFRLAFFLEHYLQ